MASLAGSLTLLSGPDSLREAVGRKGVPGPARDHIEPCELGRFADPGPAHLSPVDTGRQTSTSVKDRPAWSERLSTPRTPEKKGTAGTR